MKSVNEQIAEMQKKTMESLEPMQNMNNVAAQAFERIARKNYDLMGDLVEYAVAQVKLPEGEADVQKVYEQRVAETKAFADKVNERAAEYVALAGELGEMVSSSASAAADSSAPATKSKAPAAKKAAAKKRTAKAK
ncbi:MAG: phasin family protein [Granulosicoccus sp.]